MLGIQDLWLFILSGLLLNVTPGPDTAYIVGRSVQMGWRGGAAAVLGISTGCLVHVFAAALGLFRRSPRATASLAKAGVGANSGTAASRQAMVRISKGMEYFLSSPSTLPEAATSSGDGISPAANASSCTFSTSPRG